MHGRGGEEDNRKRSRHMWTVPSPVNNRASIVSAVDSSSSSLSSLTSANSFYKDGRKISVGDCALFKPPQDCPPFIGIIHWLTLGKENKVNLGVNWLYRPAEVKLRKGILLEAAPNEVFYSFHKDEISAASLLHPCKVSFLPKGVEIPSSISSYVCRRVYDITNKCLCWLIDQVYINEQQEEVDNLLYKTQREMHATVNTGGRSPKPMNGPTSIAHAKPGSDDVQDTVSSFHSQVKGKKREHGDQGYEPNKRERFSKSDDDGDSGHCRSESSFRSEISNLAEKGGLVDSEGVEKLVQLILPDRNPKKIDLACRSMLAGIIAATDKFECLSRFVQLRGLPVLDEWLQEVHKGKIGDSSGSKDSDKDAEEFLLILLRALDKLPINLQALQMCNIGKSVNHLRTHRNLDIHKKAKSLVDLWKKRVEAEMNIKDVKTGSSQAVSWSARRRVSEVSHGGNRHSAGSSEVAVKRSVMQFSGSKTGSVKLIQGESTVKLVNSSPVSADSKDVHPWITGGAPDLSLVTVKDEKSSNSSHSNNSQSSPIDHTKIVGKPGKEDGRSCTTGSVSVNKVSGGSSRHQKAINGFPGIGHSGAQRETGSSRNSSLHKNLPLGRLSQSGLTCEKALDVSGSEGSNKLIVKIPNHSVAKNATGGSPEDTPVMINRDLSHTPSEKQDQVDPIAKERMDHIRFNTSTKGNNESWQSNDVKDVLTGSDEGDGSPAPVLDEERSKVGDDIWKMGKISKATSSSSGSELNPQKLYEKAYFSSINALIDCCAKYSDTNASSSAGEDVGMNLLASVAAGEISKSEQVPPTSSEQRRHETEHSCQDDDSKVKVSPGHGLAEKQRQRSEGTDIDGENHVNIRSEETLAVEHNGCQQDQDPCLVISGELNKATLVASVAEIHSCATDETTNNEGDEPKGKKVVSGVITLGTPVGRQKVVSSSLPKGKDNGIVNDEVLTDGVEISSSSPGLETTVENNRTTTERLKCGVQTVQKSPAIMMHSGMSKRTNEEELLVRDPASDEVAKQPYSGSTTDAKSHANQTEIHRAELENNASEAPKDQGVSASESFVINGEGECMVENPEKRDVQEKQSSEPASQVLTPPFPMENTEQCLKTQGSKLTATETDEADECTSTTAAPFSVSTARGSDMDGKVEFDLNEGFNADDGKYMEQSEKTPDSGAFQLISPLAFPVSVSTSHPASIRVASAAKGSFAPPEDLLRSKAAFGWKGSAATSAFRPAEPRKTVEVTTNISLPDGITSKYNRLHLDFDLNVADETFEDQEMGSVSDNNMHDSAQDKLMYSAPGRCAGGLELDLNQTDEAADIVNFPTSNGHRLSAPHLPDKSVSGLPNGKLSVHRDFDLNVGPLVDEVSSGPLPFSQLPRTAMPSQHTDSGLGMNNTELGNFSSWFSPGNAYSTVSVPSIMPERGDLCFPVVASGGPQRMLAPPMGSSPFGSDVYRGPVLSSSPAMPFQSTPWQYPVFPFGTSFPLPSATFPLAPAVYMDSSSAGRLCYPAVHSQFLGSAGAISSNYQRPYLIGLPDGSNNSSASNSIKWGRQGLDLNSGPGGLDIGGDDKSPLAVRQLSVASSQALVEEQERIYQVAGSGIKRKEPEAGWENYRQSSWQ